MTRTFLALTALCAFACSKEDRPGSGDAGEPVSPRDLIYYNRVKDELAQLSRMVQSRPDDASLRVQLGEVLLAAMMTDEAEAELATALELDPANEAAADRLFQLRFDRGDVEAAHRILAAALAESESALLRAREGRYLAHVHPDDLARAIAAYRAALALDAAHVDASFELGRLLLKQGEVDEAVSLLERVIQRQRNHLGAHYNLALALRRKGDAAAADRVAAAHKRLSHLDDLGHLDDPDSADASLVLAYMYRSGKHDEEALAELERARVRFPRHPEILTEHAMALLRCGRRADAFAAFEDGMKAVPGDAGLMNRFAWVLATRSQDGDDHRRAARLAERAVAASGRKNPDYLDTLAQARARVGNHETAIAAVVEALRLKPGDQALTRRLEQLRRDASKTP